MEPKKYSEIFDEMECVQHEGLMCEVCSVEYDFVTRVGVLKMQEQNCCDMQGCCKLFEGIDSGVKEIKTYAGDELDTVYIKRPDGWGGHLRGRVF